MTQVASTPIRLSLRENWLQFTLLIIVNAFVGAMVGLERTVVPLLAEEEFGLVSRAAILSFLISFGLIKAITNLFTGRIGDRIGRKRVLIAGWLVGLPVPILIILAPGWGWVVFANVLLGVNQGLCWSTTVIMKIDLAGPKQRGLAMGLNEFAGYLAVSLSALMTGYVAATYGIRPYPFYPGVIFAVLGFLLSLFFVRETVFHQPGRDGQQPERWHGVGFTASLSAGVRHVIGSDRYPGGNLSRRVGCQPTVYRRAQRPLGRKWLIAVGMWTQAAGIGLLVVGRTFNVWLGGVVLLGLGTAMVYPTLLAAISDVAHPEWRGSAVGVYRLWRDGGYAVGALMAGLLADALGIPAAIAAIGGLTLLSGLITAAVMRETLTNKSPS